MLFLGPNSKFNRTEVVDGVKCDVWHDPDQHALFAYSRDVPRLPVAAMSDDPEDGSMMMVLAKTVYNTKSMYDKPAYDCPMNEEVARELRSGKKLIEIVSGMFSNKAQNKAQSKRMMADLMPKTRSNNPEAFSQFESMTVEEFKKTKLGVKRSLVKGDYARATVKQDVLEALPTSFDTRLKWTYTNKPAWDQAHCTYNCHLVIKSRWFMLGTWCYKKFW